MHFEILGDLTGVETIATGTGIREIARLRKRYGRGRWRKRKGIAEIRLGRRVVQSGCYAARQTGSAAARSCGCQRSKSFRSW